MKIIKCICSLTLFVCLVGIVLIPFIHEADTISLTASFISITVIALIAVIAFIGGLAIERYEDELDFAEFIHQEHLKTP